MATITIEQCKIQVPTVGDRMLVHIPKDERRTEGIDTGKLYQYELPGTPKWSGKLWASGQLTIPPRIRNADGFDYGKGDYVDLTIHT